MSYASVPYGFGLEVGHDNLKKNKVNYYVGFSADFGEAATKGSDVLFYTKGVYFFEKNIGFTGLAGVEDLNSFVLGLGARVVIPSDAFKIVVEPMWRTNGSRVNVGFNFNF